MKVLIVDDSPTMLRIIEDTVRELDKDNNQESTIRLAEDGIKALSILKKESDFDLILTDWNMPNLNGLAFLQKVKRMEEHIDTPVVMITSVGSKKEVLAAIKSGAKGYVVKPFSKDILKQKLIASLS